MRIHGVTHIAIDVDSPGRMLRYLRDTFGLQALQEGYWHGDYVWLVGAPGAQPGNPAFLALHRRQAIPRGQLNHLGLGVNNQSTAEAVAELQAKGVYVDVAGGDMVYGPEELHIQIDSFAAPRPIPTDDPAIQLRPCPVDPDLPSLVSGINHVALDVEVPTRMIDWLSHLFDTDGRRQWMRKGWYISNAYYTDTVPDPVGRRPGLMPLFRRPGLPRVRLNHVAFEFEDADAAIGLLEARGVKVDLEGDAMMHGPEDLWWQIDSRTAPFPLGHVANDAGLRLGEGQ